ncbi:pickpocket protein 28 isoform X2 [Cephus cinctus]|uniref:Pickpocket protein 28 isoform X2 n=1 Tax=Cephus cinctus TaxID=211228 RepID=A0AAJ7FL54_CEPCN|nr:pickpocket protein 28 isoform X2 [Cephus cinctus]
MHRRMKRTVSPNQENPLPIICLEEIVSDAITKSLAKVKDVGELKTTTVQLGTEKMRAKTALGKYLVDFAHNSTIHGLNHIVARRRHPVERFLAGLFVAGALICLALLSWTFWNRYQYEATSITLNHDYRNFQIPSPSVIVCPISQIDNKKFPAVFKKQAQPNNILILLYTFNYSLRIIILKYHLPRYDIQDTPKAREFFTFISNVTYDTMINVMNYEEVPSSLWLEILHDLWTDVQIYPSFGRREFTETIDNIVTEVGICKAFANPTGIYSTMQYWRTNNWTTFPIDIETLPSVNYETRTVPKNYLIKGLDAKVALFYPANVMYYGGEMFHISGTRKVSVSVEVQEIMTHDELKFLPQYQRHCGFPEDGGLTMWPIYSRAMCFFEYKMKRIRQFCNCLPHFARPMPNVPICNAEQLRCIGENVANVVNNDLKNLQYSNCIQDCDMVRYTLLSFSSVEMGPIAMGKTDISITLNFPYDIQYRILHFGLTDFLAAVGGAAGLFVGASIISFIEIFYYATLRLFWYIVKLNQQKRKRVP